MVSEFIRLKEHYHCGYLYEKDGEVHLIINCSCGKSEDLWIVPIDGEVRRVCEDCGREIVVELMYKEEGDEGYSEETVHLIKLFRYTCQNCGWGHTTTHYDLVNRLRCLECKGTDFVRTEIDLTKKHKSYTGQGDAEVFDDIMEKGGTIK